MNSWFQSPRAAVNVSSLALLAFIGYALMEFRYFLEEWIPGPTAAMVEALVILLIAGGWLRSLLVTASGRRAGVTALLGFSILCALIGLYDMQYVLNTPMPWPEQITVVFMLLVSIFAAVVLFRYRRVTRSTP